MESTKSEILASIADVIRVALGSVFQVQDQNPDMAKDEKEVLIVTLATMGTLWTLVQTKPGTEKSKRLVEAALRLAEAAMEDGGHLGPSWSKVAEAARVRLRAALVRP